MKSKQPRRHRTALSIALLAAAPTGALWPAQSAAQERAAATQWFTEAGLAEDSAAAGVGVLRDWSSSWQLGTHVVSGHTELSIGHWAVTHGARVDGRDGATRIGLTPVVRWWSTERRAFFVEAGIGINLIGPTYRTTNRHFSTAFNFGDHLGLGWRTAGPSPWDVSLRVSHFSNGGIKKPNSGENFVQLRFAAAF